jgi:hypothetical protein
LILYTIYDRPADFPTRFVVRAWWVHTAGVELVPGGVSLADTLDDARAAIPPGHVLIARDELDDPVIVETWA